VACNVVSTDNISLDIQIAGLPKSVGQKTSKIVINYYQVTIPNYQLRSAAWYRIKQHGHDETIVNKIAFH